MWIIAPVVCAVAIVVAFLPAPEHHAGNPVDLQEASEPRATWLPMVVATTVTLAVIGVVLRVVLAA